MATVLVTGGAGYIGSHACKCLSQAGHLPVVFDNLATGWRDAVKYGPFVEGDLLDRASIEAALRYHTPDAVMHFAGSIEVGESTQDPGKYWKNNLVGTLTLLEAMVATGVVRLVFSSTCAIFGNQDGVLLDEDTAQAPMNAYAASKRAIENMIDNFSDAHGIAHVTFRYFNVAGADEEGEIGEAHAPETHLVPLMLQAVAGERSALTINGADYNTPDGTCIRDYVHVMDLVDAHILGLEWLMDGRESRAFNLGTGSGFSVREVVEASRLVTNRDVPVKEGPRRPGDAVRLVSGSARAKDELGWTPTRSTMPQMIRDAWAWYKSGGYSKGL
ncbi:MAG: UDP-glucose 4-epimerase GalE [Pseudomonadota bacterium]